MGATAKIRVRKPARADGTTQVRLQVVLDREIIVVNLGFTWPAELVDEQAGRCLTARPKAEQPPGYDQALAAAQKVFGPDWKAQADTYNLLLGNALGKANKIFTRALLDELPLSKETFLHDYQNTASKGDLLLFIDTQIEQRFKQGTITQSTWKNNRSTLNSLRAFRKKIPFNSLTHRFADEYDSFLKRQGLENRTSRWGRHKDVKAFLKLAQLARIKFEDPYAHFKNQPGESSWKPMSPADLAQLEAYYYYYPLCAPTSAHRRILQKFLFSCYCGLRLGDLKMMHLARLDGNELHIKHQKGKRFQKKENMIPLTDKALLYWRHGREESDGDGFVYYSDQYSNRQLQEIARVLGIATKLHFHVGRETFATNYMRDGGSVTTLMAIMGHSNIKMTMRYVHTDNDMKRDDIQRLNKVQQSRLII